MIFLKLDGKLITKAPFSMDWDNLNRLVREIGELKEKISEKFNISTEFVLAVKDSNAEESAVTRVAAHLPLPPVRHPAVRPSVRGGLVSPFPRESAVQSRRFP